METGKKWFPGPGQADRRLSRWSGAGAHARTPLPRYRRHRGADPAGAGSRRSERRRVHRRGRTTHDPDDQSGWTRHRDGPVRRRDGAQRGAGATRQRPRCAAAGSVELRDVRRPGGQARVRRGLPDADVPRRRRRAVVGLPHPGSGRKPVRHLSIRLALRQHRRLAGPGGQLDERRQRGRRVSRPVTPRWRSLNPAWCRHRTSGRRSTPKARRRRRT